MDRKALFFSLACAICLSFFELSASSVYFPALSSSPLGEKIASCIGEPLPSFSIRESDLEPEKLSLTFQKFRLRSRDEGKARANSIRCLRRMGLASGDQQELRKALQTSFRLEKDLFLLFARFLDSSIGMDRSANIGYLQARYDLLVIVQTKTEDWIFRNLEKSDETLEEEFANLYLSILRVHYDYLMELGQNRRKQYFNAKEGKQ